MRGFGLYAGWVCGLLLPAASAFAHRPYERVAGSFERSDGVSIAIARHYVDGIMGRDPVSIQFRLPNGREIVCTPHTGDAVVRPITGGVEIYINSTATSCLSPGVWRCLTGTR